MKFQCIDKHLPIMKENFFQQKQECFIQESFDYVDQKPHQNATREISFNLHLQLPPNELRNIARPENLAPRTFAVNKQICLIPHILNQNCQQTHTISKSGNNKIKLSNKQRLSIEEFFNKKQYKEVYNKLNHFPSESRNFSGKLLSVDSVADYNHKMFRELEDQPKSPKKMIEDTIDSDFQSGNLCRAFVTDSDPNQYFLLIQNDINTYGYNIWFFFRFRNIKRGLRTFHLVNMIKKTDNYKKGMQVSIFSMNSYKKDKKMWFKGGDKISFGETNFARLCHLTQKYYYLSFHYEFEDDNDEVYFALNQPYTYTRMINHITSLQKKANISQPQKKTIDSDINVEIKKLGHTIANNVIPAVRIWTDSSQNKETILLMARQHPCETVSSFVCEGMIDYLMQGNPQIKILLQKYQILVIPMINPDGVIHGSSRCNLSGFDLNRQWSEFLIKQFTPETHRIKKYLTQLHRTNPIRHFIDLHGHGKKLNSFFFSCKKGDSPSNRLIQLVMNKIQPRFSILDCTYGVNRDKENTARSQLNQMGVFNCYTLETSLMGYTTAQGEIKQFTEQDLFRIGVSVWKGIFVLDQSSEKIKEVLGFSKEQLLQSSQVVIAKISEKQKDENKKVIFDDNASDSDPEGDILDINERLEKCCRNNINLKKKITESFKKEKVKKKKKTDTKKQERKNSSQSENDSAEKMLTSLKIQNQLEKPQKQKIEKYLSLSQEKRNFNKISISNKRTTIYSRKVKEKKENPKVDEKSHKNQNQIPTKSSLLKNRQSPMNNTQIKIRNHDFKNQMMKSYQNNSKTTCSIIYEYPNESMLNTRKNFKPKIKTQCHQSSSKNIPGIFYHDPQHKNEAKYCELRQQSLKALLTDTFSVLKIKPKLSIKRYVKPSPIDRNRRRRVLTEEKQTQILSKQYSMLKKSDFDSKQRIKTFSYADRFSMSQRSDGNKEGFQFGKNENYSRQNDNEHKYKRFESFVFKGNTSSTTDRLNSSVFYYFPVI